MQVQFELYVERFLCYATLEAAMLIATMCNCAKIMPALAHELLYRTVVMMFFIKCS